MPKVFWEAVYFFYPPILRVLEKVKAHNFRQDYLVGTLLESSSLDEIKDILVKEGFEKAILSWSDPGEVLNLRKRVNVKYQHHIRFFNDKEIRGHYEFSPESHPWKHVRGAVFLDKKEYFVGLLEGFMN